MKNHSWMLNSSGVPLAVADLKAYFEAQRDHYSNTTLVAGKDPRDNKTLIKFDDHEIVSAHMDRGIAALVAAAQGIEKPVHATIRGTLRDESEYKAGDELVVSLSIAQRG